MRTQRVKNYAAAVVNILKSKAKAGRKGCIVYALENWKEKWKHITEACWDSEKLDKFLYGEDALKIIKEQE